MNECKVTLYVKGRLKPGKASQNMPYLSGWLHAAGRYRQRRTRRTASRANDGDASVVLLTPYHTS